MRRPSPATVLSLLALFVALGGTSYAAITVTGKNVKNSSLTGADVKNGSLTNADVKARSLRASAFRAGDLPRGATGPQGARGDAGPAGPGGPTGATGPAGPLVDTLPSGRTLRGYAAVFVLATGAGQLGYSSVSFPFPLAADPIAHYIRIGDPRPPECRGTIDQPEAAPGHLCVYERAFSNVGQRNVNAELGDATATRFGFAVFARSLAAGTASAYAVWAVTAP